MVDIATFRQMALSFPETTESPHFEKTSFRVKKKIFATLDVDKQLACIKLPEIDQSVFCAFDKTVIYPVPNKWGLQGWTMIDLNKAGEEIVHDALNTAYQEVAAKKVSKKPKPT